MLRKVIVLVVILLGLTFVARSESWEPREEQSPQKTQPAQQPQKTQSQKPPVQPTQKPSVQSPQTSPVQPLQQQSPTATQSASQRATVFFKADVMSPLKIDDSTTVIRLVDNVVFFHNNAVIVCDTAYRYSDRYMEGTGRVIINKDSTFIYGDRFVYNGETNIAQVFAPIIKMVEKDAVLYTYNLEFNTKSNVGTYFGGGTITQKDNLMESAKGDYYVKTRVFFFLGYVSMRNNNYKIKSDSVGFNMDTEVVTFFKKANIWNVNNEFLTADRGHYYRTTDRYDFTEKAYVLTKEQELWADSLIYDSRMEEAQLNRNIQVLDTVQMIYSFGDWGHYWGGDKEKETRRLRLLLTENASVVGYEQQGDSTFMRADTMMIYAMPRVMGEAEMLRMQADSLNDQYAGLDALGQALPSLSGIPPAESAASFSADSDSLSTAMDSLGLGHKAGLSADSLQNDSLGGHTLKPGELRVNLQTDPLPIQTDSLGRVSQSADSLGVATSDSLATADLKSTQREVVRNQKIKEKALKQREKTKIKEEKNAQNALKNEEKTKKTGEKSSKNEQKRAKNKENQSEIAQNQSEKEAVLQLIDSITTRLQGANTKEIRQQMDSLAGVVRAHMSSDRESLDSLAQSLSSVLSAALAATVPASSSAAAPATLSEDSIVTILNTVRNAISDAAGKTVSQAQTQALSSALASLLPGTPPGVRNQESTGSKSVQDKALKSVEVFGNKSITAASEIQNRTTMPDSLAPNRADSTVGKQLSKFAASDSLAADSVAGDSLAKDSLVYTIHAFRNVKMFRNDMQSVTDSLVSYSVDSTIHMFHDPIVWSDSTQILANKIVVFTVNQQLEHALCTGDPIMGQLVEENRFNQVKGREIEAYFQNNDIERAYVNGNAETLYYMQDDETGDINGFMVSTCGNMVIRFEERKISKIVWLDQPVYSIYPLDKIPADQPTMLKGFSWKENERPKDKSEVFDRVIRPSFRAEALLILQPIFPITKEIDQNKVHYREQGIWTDRSEPVTVDLTEFVNKATVL